VAVKATDEAGERLFTAEHEIAFCKASTPRVYPHRQRHPRHGRPQGDRKKLEGDPERLMLFSLADRLRMLPSELARRLTPREFQELIAYARLKERWRQEAEDNADGFLRLRLHHHRQGPVGLGLRLAEAQRARRRGRAEQARRPDAGAEQRGAGKAEALFKGFLGYEAISRFVEFHKSVQESVGALKSQADAVGYTTDALQAYQAAFRSANLNIEAARRRSPTSTSAIGRAAMGEKEAAEAFQRSACASSTRTARCATTPRS
jgi:hypothetical protein